MQRDLFLTALSPAAVSLQVRLHDALAFRITPLSPQPSDSEWRPWWGQPMYERHEEDEGWIPPLLRQAPAAAATIADAGAS